MSGVRFAMYRVCAALLALGCIAWTTAASADGVDLSRLRASQHLDAIPRSDNGKAVGMGVTLMRDSLRYDGINGVFRFGDPVRFDGSKLPAGYRKAYRQAEGAFIYPIENWASAAQANAGNIHFSGSQTARYIYVYRSKYAPTGQKAIWVCTVLNPELGNFLNSAAGHGRCDAFADK